MVFYSRSCCWFLFLVQVASVVGFSPPSQQTTKRNPSPRQQPLLLLSSSSSSALFSVVDAANPAAAAATIVANHGAGSEEEDAWIAQSMLQEAVSAEEKEEARQQALSSIENEVDEVVIGPGRVLIYDTTLRDGTQGESVSASVNDKLKIYKRLAAFDVDYIEAGWPGSNPKDYEFFDRAKKGELSASERQKLAAFGSTRRKQPGLLCENDAQVQALIDSEAPTICIVAKSHAWQVTEILQTSLEENLNMIADTVSYLKRHGRRVMVDMEHFFDGYAADMTADTDTDTDTDNNDKDKEYYSIQCCRAAVNAGASCLVLCDTNGGTMPWQIERIVTQVRQQLPATTTLGIHCHNDCGMAVANSLLAVQAGVGLIQGTINGIGERTGNADLCSIIPTLALKPTSTSTSATTTTQMTCRPNLTDLTSVSRYVDEILNRTPNHSAPYVGASAFAHKGGLHVAAMKRSSSSYQHAEPKDVGNESRVLISELSGRQNIMHKIQQAMELTAGQQQQQQSQQQQQEQQQVITDRELSERATAILKRVKQLEAVGYTFEGAEASVDLMILHATDSGYCPPFQVLDYSAHVYDSKLDSASRFWSPADDDDDEELGAEKKSRAAATGGPTARATVKVRTMETVSSSDSNDDDDDDASLFKIQERLEVSDGNGPVDALANALMRALQPVHPSLRTVELVDYKVRILDPESATGAATRVLIEFRNQDKEWTTVSVDTNVISASLNALIDGFEYALLEYNDHDNCLLLD